MFDEKDKQNFIYDTLPNNNFDIHINKEFNHLSN